MTLLAGHRARDNDAPPLTLQTRGMLSLLDEHAHLDVAGARVVERSVRQLALDADVHPRTVQTYLASLEKAGRIRRERGGGFHTGPTRITILSG